MSTILEKIEHIRLSVDENRRLTVHEVESVSKIFTDSLGMIVVRAEFIPKLLKA